MATVDALKNMSSPKSIADRRSKHVSEIIKRRNVIVGNNLDNPVEGGVRDENSLIDNNNAES
jgi:hypothetical protein